MPSNHLILCHPLLLLPTIFPSIRVFSSESALRMRWPKDWSFSFNISPSIEHAGLISFRMDWLDLLAVQGTLKNLLQHHSSKASFLCCSAFFTVQLSHPYMTPGKTIAWTRWTFSHHLFFPWVALAIYSPSTDGLSTFFPILTSSLTVFLLVTGSSPVFHRPGGTLVNFGFPISSFPCTDLFMGFFLPSAEISDSHLHHQLDWPDHWLFPLD